MYAGPLRKVRLWGDDGPALVCVALNDALEWPRWVACGVEFVTNAVGTLSKCI